MRGELSGESVRRLQPAFQVVLASGGPVVVDMSSVPFMDLHGLYALLAFRDRLRRQSRAFTFLTTGQAPARTRAA